MAKNLSIRFSAASSAAAISSSSSGSGNTPSAPSVPPFDELPADGGGSTASVVTTNTVIAAAVAVAPTTTAPLASASASPTAVASSGSESSSSSSPVTVHSASAASADIDIIQLSAEVKKGSGGGAAAAVSSAQTWPTLSCDSTAPTGDRARPNGHDYVTVANSRSAPSASSEGSSTATTTTLSSSMSRSSSTTAAATTTKESPDKDETISPVNTPQQQPSVIANSSGKNSSNSNRSSSSNKSSPTVGSKVDRFVRQLQESFTSSSSSSKAEPPTATMSWCKFAKGAEGVGGSGAALEIISQSAAESDDSLLSRERVSITLTPAAATAAPSPPNHTASTMTTSSTSSSKSPSAASAAYNSWLADMKTFKEKWSKTEKAEKNSKSGGDEFPSTLSSSRSSSTLVTTSSTATTSSTTPSSSSSSVTVSNAYLNNNYTLVNNNSSHVCTGSTCSACSAARRTVSQSTVQAPSTLPVQSFTGSSVYCATCLTTTNSDHQHQHHQHHHHQHHHHHHHHHHQQQSNSKSNAINSNATPQRTPTPPLLLSPNEVVFDPNFDPYLVGETSRDNNNMIFSFGRSSSSSEKKEKKDKDKEGKSGRAKLFTGSSSSQSKEKDAAAVAAAAKKKSKEKERDKEKDKDKDTSNSFFKINTSRSSSVSSPTSANISSSNLTTSFLLGFSKNSSSPSHSRYSSQENISINSDNLNWSKNSNNNNNNIPKSSNSSSASSKQLSSSRSMISFRKLTKNGENESEVTFEDLDLSTTYNQDTRNSFGPQPSNPTLRRKADSFRRNDSPTTTTTTTTTESGGHFSLLDGDTMSMASSKSSNSNSSASALFHRSHSISTADLSSLGTPSELQPARSPTARQRISQLSHAVLPSSWATCIAYAYYIFALVVALLSLLISLISPLPAFFNGLVLGFVCTFLLVTVVIIYIVSHYVLVKSPDSDEEKPSGLLRSQLSGESISLKRSLNRPKLSTNSLITTASGTAVEPDLYSGWVYEFIGEYEEREKNGFLSQLVHVVLRGTRLTIYTPATELNEKKLKALLAAENSSGGGSGSSSSGSGSSSSKAQPGVTFASQRVIEFSRQSRKPRVSLLLTKNVRNQRKYVWSKKYPVCLEFVDDRATSGGGYIVVGKSNDEAAPPLRGGSSSSSNESSSSLVDAATIPLQTTTPFSTTSSSASPVPLKLVLFARSCREKEEWFWAMKMAVDMASKGGSTDVSPKSSNLNIADSTTQLLTTTTTTTITSTTSEQTEDFSSGSAQQYLRILTRRLNYSAFMRANVLSGEGGGGGLGASGMHQNPLTWFNVLLNRLSFDILNKPNWSAYIAKKLQRKLRKLRLPYFMESLTITEIDIGTTLPKFNSVPTPPVVDDAGLWIDFDVSYSGMSPFVSVSLFK